MAVVRDILVRLGVKFSGADKVSLDQYTKGMELARTGALALAGAAAAAIAGIAGLTLEYATAADEAIKLARATGISVEELTRLSPGALKSGLSIEQFSKALQAANRNLLAFVTRGTGEASDALQQLGLDADDLTGADGSLLPISELLPKIADGLQGVSETQRGAVLSRIFGEEGGAKLVNLLEGGAAGLDEFRRAAERAGLVVSTEAAEAAEEFNDSLTDLSLSFRGVQNAIGPTLIDAATTFVDIAQRTVDTIAPWVESTVQLIDETIGLESVVVGLAAVVAFFTTAAAALSVVIGAAGLATAFGSLAAAGTVLAIVIGGIASFAAQAGAALAGLGSVLLIFDDLAAFASGADSAFGELLQSLGLSDEAIAQLREALASTGPLLSATVDLVAAVGNMLRAVFVLGAELAIAKVGEFAALVGELITTIGQLIGLDLAPFFEGVGLSIQSLTDLVSALASGLNTAASGFDALGDFAASNGIVSAGAEFLGLGGSTTNNNTTNNTSAQVNVNGAGDPNAVASAVLEQVAAAGSLVQGDAL